MGKFKIALCQMKVKEDKGQNIVKALSMIAQASGEGAELVVLPEMFNCPYDNRRFREYAEDVETGQTLIALAEIAKEKQIYLVGGSIPEIEDNKIYNSSFIFDPRGEIIAKHRKVHLFDVDIKGGIRFLESETLSSGDESTVVQTTLGNIGVAICYDMRFPELMLDMVEKGAEIIVVPAAFNMTTGPAHWEALIRIRAVDNQVYMVAVSPARDYNTSYVAYGHSLVADPWGDIIARAGADEEIVYCDIDRQRIQNIRKQLPLLKHRRGRGYS